MATLTKQELFKTALLAKMSEEKGVQLTDLCEKLTATGGETVTFNRIKASTASDGVSSMYGADGQENGGDLEAFKATIGYVSAQEKLTQAQMNSTALDVKNTYVASLSRAVDRKIDDKIVAAIEAKAANLTKIELTGGLTKDNVTKIVGAIIAARASAEMTPDNHAGVALVMNKKDWAELATSDYVLNSDYNKLAGAKENGAGSFFGAIVKFTGVAEGTMYVVPSMTVGVGEWENSVKATCEYHETDGMRYHCQAVKSVGAVCIEPEAIVKITVA